MSCKEGNGWLPAELNNDRQPFLAENTFYARNESRIFDPSRSGFSEKGCPRALLKDTRTLLGRTDHRSLVKAVYLEVEPKQV